MRSPTTFRSLSQASPPALSRLMQRARQLHNIALTIKEFLPKSLAEHCQPGNIDNDTLFVHVNSPAWATKLRYFTPELIKYLQNHPQTKGIRHICITVRPAISKPAAVDIKPKRLLSQENAALLRHAATTADSPRLSAALRRLAQHANVR